MCCFHQRLTSRYFTKRSVKSLNRDTYVPRLQKSLPIKNHYPSKFIRLKDPNKKEETQIRYKE